MTGAKRLNGGENGWSVSVFLGEEHHSVTHSLRLIIFAMRKVLLAEEQPCLALPPLFSRFDA